MILLVDDNDAFNNLMREIVEPMGYRFRAVSSGEAALAALTDEARCALIFMDYGLPGGMSGIAAAVAIRQLPPDVSEVPIIGLTGGMAFGDVDQRPAARFALELRKPVLPSDIEKVIKQFARIPGGSRTC